MTFSALSRLVAPIAALMLTGAMLAGCSAVGGVGEAGALLTGRDSLPPLKVKPPAGKPTVQFLPFTGLPVTTADSIYRRIRTGAATQGIELVHRLEDSATYRVKAHFVALGNETSTTVIFTYDIYDASGTNVQRILGQEVAQSAEGDAWAGVDGTAQDRLAARAVRALSAWLHGERR